MDAKQREAIERVFLRGLMEERVRQRSDLKPMYDEEYEAVTLARKILDEAVNQHEAIRSN